METCSNRQVAFMCLAALYLLSAPIRSLATDSLPSNYCGIYAVYGAAKALGSGCSFDNLVDESFVSSDEGSSTGDLIRAVSHLGLASKAYRGLGVASLRAANSPLILHVSSDGQYTFHGHWLLFLGVEGNMGLVVDSSEGVQKIPISEICAKWDGVALAVFKKDHRNVEYSSIEISDLFVILLGVSLSLAVSACVVYRFCISLYAREFLIVVLSSGILLLFFGRMENSCLRSVETNRKVYASVWHKEFPMASLRFVESCVVQGSGNTTLVDARRQQSFDFGSIPGAVNLPVDISDTMLAVKVENWDRDKTLCIFCQSSGCKFGDLIATRLSGLGFRNILIYREGYKGWVQARKKG